MHDRAFTFFVMTGLAILLLPACAPRPSVRVDPSPLGPNWRTPYRLEALARVALVAPRNLTPSGEAVVRLEDPLTGALIRTIRNRCPFELVPGHLPDTRSFLESARDWYRRPRRRPFPESPFDLLVRENPADAYLLVWLDRSARPWVTGPDRVRRPADRLVLEATAVLLAPSGKALWAVTTRHDTTFPPGGLPDAARQAVHDLVDGVVRAFLEVGKRT